MAEYQKGKYQKWEGGECPVPVGTLVDVIFRDGYEVHHTPAGTTDPTAVGVDAETGGRAWRFAFDWEDDDRDEDIVAWRLHDEGES